jgi:hypothetical protein
MKTCSKPCTEIQIENGLCSCFGEPSRPLLPSKDRKKRDLEKSQTHYNNQIKPLIKKS